MDEGDAATPVWIDPCEGVQCGALGECVSAASGEAVCRCAEGSHADGTNCVEDVEGEECSGVACSGHGTCAVAAGPPPAPVCLCDEGYDTVERTNCVAEPTEIRCGAGTHEERGVCVADAITEDGGTPPPDAAAPAPAPIDESCRSNADCDDAETCSYDTGECLVIVASECGPPPAVGGGFRGLFGACGTVEGLGAVPPYRDAGLCDDGLTCVSTSTFVLDGAAELIDGYGLCFQACDPCAPDCGAGMECIALAGGGGFCNAGTLRREGEACSSGSTTSAPRICEAGTQCIAGECARPCAPNPGVEVPLYSAFTISYPSVDCSAGEVCALKSRTMSDVDAGVFACREGAVVDTGETCAPADGLYCEAPDSCGTVGICSPVCETSAECAAGVECFHLLGWDHRCIPDGSLSYGSQCTEDRNCGSGLSCRTVGYPASVFTCQLT